MKDNNNDNIRGTPTPPPVVPGEPAPPKGVNSRKPTVQDTTKVLTDNLKERGKLREEARKESDAKRKRKIQRPDNDEIRLKTKEENENLAEKQEKHKNNSKLFKFLDRMQSSLEKMSSRNAAMKPGGAPTPFNQYSKEFMSMPLEARRKLIHERQRQYDEATRNRTVYGRVGQVGRGVESAANYFAGSADDSLQRKALGFLTGSMISGTKNWARRVEMKRGVSFGRNFDVPTEEEKEKEKNKESGKGGTGKGGRGGKFDADVKGAILSVKTNTDEIVKAVKSIDTRMSENSLDKAERDKEEAALRDAKTKAAPNLLHNKADGDKGGGGIGGGIIEKLSQYAGIADGLTDIIDLFKRGKPGRMGIPGTPGGGFGAGRGVPGGKPGRLGQIGGKIKGWITGNPNGAVQDAAGKWRLPKGSTAGRGGSYTSAPKGNIFKRGADAIANGAKSFRSAPAKGLLNRAPLIGGIVSGGLIASDVYSDIKDTGRVKGSTVGRGVGMVAGGTYGASLGTAIGGVPGGLIGGAAGAFAGSELGSKIGGGIESGYGKMSTTFGGSGSLGADIYNMSHSSKNLDDPSNINSGSKRYIKNKDGETEMREGGSRAWRNNNPGNLRNGKFAKAHGAVGEDGAGFAIFPTKEAGDAAQKALLKNKYFKSTISEMISKYAPPSENDTGHYIQTVAKAVGVPASTKLSDLTEQQFEALRAAMKKHEGFKEGNVTKLNSSQTPSVAKTDSKTPSVAKTDSKTPSVAKDYNLESAAIPLVMSPVAAPSKSGTQGAVRTTMAFAKRDAIMSTPPVSTGTASGAVQPSKSSSGGVPDRVSSQVPITRNPDSTVKRIQQMEMAGRAT